MLGIPGWWLNAVLLRRKAARARLPAAGRHVAPGRRPPRGGVERDPL